MLFLWDHKLAFLGSKWPGMQLLGPAAYLFVL